VCRGSWVVGVPSCSLASLCWHLSIVHGLWLWLWVVEHMGLALGGAVGYNQGKGNGLLLWCRGLEWLSIFGVGSAGVV